MDVVFQLILAIVFSSIFVVCSFNRAGQGKIDSCNPTFSEIFFSFILIAFGSLVFYLSTLEPSLNSLFTYGIPFFSIGLGTTYKHIHLWMTTKIDKVESAKPKKA